METITKHFAELVVFHQVAVEKHFGRAAEALGTSKGLVSKQVRRLEAALGGPLFHRTTRRVELTDSGLALHHSTRQIFEIAGEAGRRLGEMSRGSVATLKFAAPVALGEAFFPDLARALRAELPRVAVDFELTDEPRELVEHGLDFALRINDHLEPDVRARYVGHIREVIVAAPGLLRQRRGHRWRDPQQLHATNCILNLHRPAWNSWTFHRGADDFTVEVTGLHVTNHPAIARALALDGRGIAKLPYYLVKADLEAGRLARVFQDYELRGSPLSIVYAKSDEGSRGQGQGVRTAKTRAKSEIFRWFRQHAEYFVRPS